MQLTAPFTLCAAAGLSPPPALCRPASIATSAGRSLCDVQLCATVYQTESVKSTPIVPDFDIALSPIFPVLAIEGEVMHQAGPLASTLRYTV